MGKFTTIRVYERNAEELREYAKKWNLNLAQVISRLLDVFYSEQLNAIGNFDRVRNKLLHEGYTPTDMKTEPEE